MTSNLIRIQLAARRFGKLAGLVIILGWSSPVLALPVVRSDITNANPSTVRDPVHTDRIVGLGAGAESVQVAPKPRAQRKPPP